MVDVIERWRRAAERADEEKVRILLINGEYRATSSSTPLSSYALRRGPDGWTCECIANREYGLPCKHLSKLADVLGLDVLTDVVLDIALLSDDFDRSAA
ncbi:MAG TPA: hypothetical protein VF221_13940 [Chloroflexota bacterium]